jgi:hypothetical protein
MTLVIQSPPINAASLGVRQGVQEAMQRLAGTAILRAGVIIGGGKPFIAPAPTCGSSASPWTIRNESSSWVLHRPLRMASCSTLAGVAVSFRPAVASVRGLLGSGASMA